MHPYLKQLHYQKFITTADFVLRTIEIIDPLCIVAGGMPRDIDNGKTISDIDLFFYVNPNLKNKDVNTMIRLLGFEEVEVKDGSNIPEHYKKNEDLMCVFNTNVDGISVQLMRMCKPTQQSVIPKFPLSISQIWYKRGKLGSTPLYNKCKEKKVIIKTNDIYESKHPFIEKICAKYDDWTYLGE